MRDHAGLDLSAEEAIVWATKGRNTTKRGPIPGGLGLKLLTEFIGLNGGRLQIVSEAGYWCQQKDQIRTARLPLPFPGTAVSLEINTADKQSYVLSSELKDFGYFLMSAKGRPPMSKNVTLSILEVVGSPLCVASDDGQKVHDRIAAALREGQSVTISFLNVTSLTSAFLNAAIGQLYGSFSEEDIRSKLKVTDLQPDDRALLKRVVDTAKEYFKDPERFKDAERATSRDS